MALKKWGQHFLNNSAIAKNMVDLCFYKSGFEHIEIGSGFGILTKLMLSKGSLFAYEIDSRLYRVLRNKFRKDIKENRLTLFNENVLDAWKSKSLYSRSYELVSNLPYNISLRVILNCLEDVNFKRGVFTVQKDVAERICSKDGDSSFCYISILTKLTSKARLVFDIAPNNFSPVPKVISSVFVLEKYRKLIGKDSVFQDKGEFKKFNLFLKTSFLHPRKKLIKNLSLKYDMYDLMIFFDSMKISTLIRAHELSSQNYLLLFRKIKVLNEHSKEK